MPDECAPPLDWWKVEKAASLARKKRAAATAGASANPGDTFLVVTEGTVTEPVYFHFLLKDLQLYAVQVVVMPGAASDPRHVIETAAKEVKDLRQRARNKKLAEDEIEKFDQIWAVIDTDVAVRMGYWNDVKQLAEARKVKLAHSTPCFEYWLLLHLDHTTRADLVDGTAAKRAVRDALGQEYSTDEDEARAAMPLFMPHWPEAATRAKRVRDYHAAAATPEPANPSTEVDLLVRALNDAAPDHARKDIS